MHTDCWYDNRKEKRREDNIKINLKMNKLEEYGLDSSGLGQSPVADSCEKGDETSDSTK
jgi:hypothetical protein